MRIAFDGHAFSSPAGGVRRYVSELARALAELPDVHMLAIGAEPQASLPGGVRGVPAASWVPTNLGWSVDGLPRAARRTPFDVFHAPAYTAPLWGVHPYVVTLHDVSYERRPEWYPYRVDRVRRWFYRRSAVRADLVITDSQFSRLEIEAAYGIPAERIRVIPLGVGAPFLVADARAVAPPDDGSVILHVGDLHPRRNVGVLVEALALLRRRGDALKHTVLVLAGADRGSGAAVQARADALGLGSAVHRVAAADDATVVAWMRRASLLAYPSLYEGFGLPALEAMAAGTPVVASTAASIPEVVGEAGLLVDPSDVRAWYDALAAVLESPSRRAQMREAGVARAATFTWRRTARATCDVYRELAGGR